MRRAACAALLLACGSTPAGPGDRPVDPGWAASPAAAAPVDACPDPRMDPPLTLLDGSSVLTDVASLGDRWALAWIDPRGVTSAHVGTVGLDGKAIAHRALGSPLLEPRIAAAGSLLGVVALSAADPTRRDLPFSVLNADLAPAGGAHTLTPAGGVERSRLALASNGTAFALLTGASPVEVVLLHPDGSTRTVSGGGGVPYGPNALAGTPEGFTFAANDGGKAAIRSIGADGTLVPRFELPSSGGLALAGGLVALAGQDVRLLASGLGGATVLSDIVGSTAPRLGLVALGAGSPPAFVVAWSGPDLSGILYHVSGVPMPYLKAPGPPGARVWVAAAGDSVGIFVSAATGGGPAETTYHRLRCR